MANRSSATTTGATATANQYNNLRLDAIGPWLDDRVLQSGTLLIGTQIVTPDVDANDLVLASGDKAGLSIQSATNNVGSIHFGDSDDANIGRIVYDHLNDALYLYTNAARAVDIDSNGTVFINDTANANMTVGLTVNQGANDDQILAGKSSDIAHGLTSAGFMGFETDDYFAFRKINPTLGGLHVGAVAEDGATSDVLRFSVMGGTADTAKTTSSIGLFNIQVEEHDGANAAADITADGNVFTVRARVGGAVATRFQVDEDGDLHAVNATITAYDHEDDVALIRAFELARTQEGIVKDGWDDFVKYNEADLVRIGVLGAPLSEGGMWNITQHMRLLNGAIWQQAKRIMALEQRLAALPEAK